MAAAWQSNLVACHPLVLCCCSVNSATLTILSQPCRACCDSSDRFTCLDWSARVNSHGLSGSVRVTHLLDGQYGCLGCQRVQYDLWHSSLGCSSLCSLRMVVLPLGWQLSGPWPVAAACFQRIRATLLPALLSFCAAVSVRQYDTYDMSQPCCHSSCSTPHSLAVQALSSQLKTRVQQEAQQLTRVQKVSLLFQLSAA